jgi:hypothetical protein
VVWDEELVAQATASPVVQATASPPYDAAPERVAGKVEMSDMIRWGRYGYGYERSSPS